MKTSSCALALVGLVILSINMCSAQKAEVEHASMGARYHPYRRSCSSPGYEAFKIPVKLNYTLTKLVTGQSPPGSMVGNVYQLYGDMWENTNDGQDRRLGRYLAATIALGESKEYPSFDKSPFPPVTMHYDAVAEFGSAAKKDSLIIEGTQDIAISDLPSDTAATIYFLDTDLAITGGLGFWQGATGRISYADEGSIKTSTTTIAGQTVDNLAATGDAIIYVYKPRGGLSMD